ncbi:hypothetical protein Ccrd_003087 [Cynara cardunculus var. scolymus]|uniref:Uncharacterized protein n=1 Tax=Cynara cardunculus var. scolymus TaxID=59895 RepID=A0A124SCT8_CYNCS|nr:hypothetical protein Ccrd_003087 [Cynara cardunculus var. scolymus]
MSQYRRALMNLLPWRSLLVFTIFVFFMVGQTECTRTSSDHVFRVVDPNSNHQFSGNFFGFLPKRKTPLPTSGPSRKHNDVGPENWRIP